VGCPFARNCMILLQCVEPERCPKRDTRKALVAQQANDLKNPALNLAGKVVLWAASLLLPVEVGPGPMNGWTCSILVSSVLRSVFFFSFFFLFLAWHIWAAEQLVARMTVSF